MVFETAFLKVGSVHLDIYIQTDQVTKGASKPSCMWNVELGMSLVVSSVAQHKNKHTSSFLTGREYKLT